MTFEIASRYEDSKKDIVEKLHLGLIQVNEEATKNNSCYFCVRRIEEERMQVLTEDDRQTKTKYFAHESCYRKALSSLVINLN